ncbi:tRNA uridine-5-carboxymethylaminomethyl(34) synthesis GTPase MnmE [Sutterella sp.]|uniref:tRNA uridine-5-carboxymethylaminomethyl(34) synthesis GTPase MnmE n=1 Tax=Sutterella sp. TaxID=1981025 RepID=UPI0026DECC89|nr:tRNA uridine-5-carboxymethylaminomethyl(34) synthesis GTPase MnmE [Sutterella sp.]MDO5530437.1 tRNA uridine-5-carboxymethylaminomethyl(34) synthesis GTPase MnmE [Sutterella sp.]
MPSDKDPIIAIATAAGRGAIGIVRLTFPVEHSAAITGGLFPGVKLEPRHAHLLPVTDAEGRLLDRAIVLFFPAPASYTGESVLEIQAHGGPMVLRLILRAALGKLSETGLRIAEPGEFTKRAFLNGRMDLAQAEAVGGLIDAVSEAAAQAAARSLTGEFSTRVRATGTLLDEARALTEAQIDFPEEELDGLMERQITERMEGAAGEIDALLATARRGTVLADGLTVALVGAPNVGKSSLLNALAGEEIAIVTDIAGTTRDSIEHWTAFEGVPLRIIDTAGLRETSDIVEQKGIDRTLRAIAEADIVLALTDASGRIPDDEAALARVRSSVREGTPLLTVANKADAADPETVMALKDRGAVAVSALTGEGLEELRARVLELSDMAGGTEGLFLARERHLECLRRAREHIGGALAHARAKTGMTELLAEELRLAGRALGEILGETDAEGLLDIIFSRFCIGK